MSSLDKTQPSYFSSPVDPSAYKRISPAIRSRAQLGGSGCYDGSRKAAITMIAVGTIAVIGVVICAILLHAAFPQDAFLNAISHHHWTILGVGGGMIGLGAGTSLINYYKNRKFREFSKDVDHLYEDKFEFEEKLPGQSNPIRVVIRPFAAYFGFIKNQLQDSYDANMNLRKELAGYEETPDKYVLLKPGDSFHSLTIDFKDASYNLRRGHVDSFEKIIPQGHYVVITKDAVQHFSQAKQAEAAVDALSAQGYMPYDLR